MALPDFTIDLGNGTYVDNTGALKTSRDDGKASFKLPASLPIAGSDLQKTFKAFETVVPNLNKLGVFDNIAKANFEGLGLSDDFLELLGKAANIAQKLGSIMPVVSIVVGLANILGLFGGSDPVKDLINQQFNKLFQWLDEAERDAQTNYISQCMGVFDAALSRVEDYKNVLNNLGYSTDAEINAKRALCESLLADYDAKLFDAARGHVWGMPFNVNDYKFNRVFLPLCVVPDNGAPTAKGTPTEAHPFDHRVMLPLLIYGTQTYLTLIKAISPEHRSTGQFHADLLKLADGLANRLTQMRQEVLGVTHYRAGDPLSVQKTVTPFGVLTSIDPIPVGAVDLRADTDKYFESAEALKTAAAHGEPNRRGNLNRTWTPPAGMPFADYYALNDWWILTPAAADASNRQAMQDYGELLVRSGYLTLAHLEATVRHLATEPDLSETVTGRAELWRKPLAGHDVVVVDDKIPLSDLITATAHREPQECEADVYLTTQPAIHAETIGYRIRLLTLHDGVTPFEFDQYVWTSYVPVDPMNPQNRDWELRVSENSGLPLDPINPATGTSAGLLKDQPTPGIDPQTGKPIEIIERGKTATLTADTFDWYVPIPTLKTRPGIASLMADDLATKVIGELGGASGAGSGAGGASSGGSASGSVSTARVIAASELVRGGAESGLSSYVGWEGGQQTWKGQKREWQRTQVEISYDLFWTSPRGTIPAQLALTLRSRPQDRNFCVYVVVEEFLKRTRQWLRTAVKVQFNGQLTYVPQSFFDEEDKARKHAADVLGKMAKDYSVSRQPQPGDPVSQVLQPGVNENAEGMLRAFNAFKQYAPEIYDRAVGRAGQTEAV